MTNVYVDKLHEHRQWCDERRRPQTGHPPPSGWPQITQAGLSRLGKLSTKVLDLLKNLPDIENDDNFDLILVWSLSGCNDSTDTAFQRGL